MFLHVVFQWLSQRPTKTGLLLVLNFCNVLIRLGFQIFFSLWHACYSKHTAGAHVLKDSTLSGSVGSFQWTLLEVSCDSTILPHFVSSHDFLPSSIQGWLDAAAVFLGPRVQFPGCASNCTGPYDEWRVLFPMQQPWMLQSCLSTTDLHFWPAAQAVDWCLHVVGFYFLKNCIWPGKAEGSS